MTETPIQHCRRAGPLVLTGAALLGFAGGCSTYDPRYTYEPRPVEVDLVQGPGREAVQVLLSVIGVRRPDEALGIGRSIEVRLRIHNRTAQSVQLDPGGLQLFAADLWEFPDPIVEPPGVLRVGSGGTAVVRAYFPFPEGSSPGDRDLEGLHLSWSGLVGDEPATARATFTRRRQYISDPHVYFGVGHGWGHGWGYGHLHHGYHGHFYWCR